jgi:biopolymer transport protein ExbB/TolQ
VHERGFVIKLEFDSSIVCLWATNFSSVMKIKTLRKKIRRLETRLREGPKKLARLKRKLEAQVRADEAAARRKAAARVAAARRAARRKKVKRTLNLSPERRAQLADAMRARWAAKRAAAVPSPEQISANRDSTPEQGAEGPAGPIASWP